MPLATTMVALVEGTTLLMLRKPGAVWFEDENRLGVDSHSATWCRVAHARSEFASHLFCPELVLDANPTLAISARRKSSNDSLKINENCNGFNATGWLFKITGGRWWMVLIEDSRRPLSFKENSLLASH
ncbi:hypothetical protein C3L33_16185, partial [Rhododendron williamsianum]